MATDGINAARLDPTGLQPADLHHVGMVVADRDEALARLRALGGGQASLTTTSRNPHARFHDGGAGLEFELGFIRLGGLLVEVQQPLDEVSPQARYLREHGEGLHHLAFEVAALDEEVARLTATGASVQLDASGPGNEARWVYLDSPALGVSTLELMEKSPIFEKFWAHVAITLSG